MSNESLRLKGTGIVWDENVWRKSRRVALWGHTGPLVPQICCDKERKENIETMLLQRHIESSNATCGVLRPFRLLESHISTEMTLKRQCQVQRRLSRTQTAGHVAVVTSQSS